MGQFTIELNQIYFYSFHGVYEEERKAGGEFTVDLFAKHSSDENPISSIKQTVNYASLYEIVKVEMDQPRDLLETIAQSIAEKIHKTFPIVEEIEIRIEKKNPPIVNFNGNVAVTYRKMF